MAAACRSPDTARALGGSGPRGHAPQCPKECCASGLPIADGVVYSNGVLNEAVAAGPGREKIFAAA